MFLLDTNMVFELRKADSGRADANVIAWAKDRAVPTLFLSAITVLEIEIGIMLVERRDTAQSGVLRHWLEARVLPAFDGRILAFDMPVARRCAGLHIPDPRPDRDAMIAATALVHGLTLVTRNVGDFEGTGVSLLNPWDTPAKG
jgi:predicted nucleic acid-binding protein